MTDLTYDQAVSQIPDLAKYTEVVKRYLPIIQNNKQPVLDLLTKSSRDRFVIYKLCELLDLRFERIEKEGIRTFWCCNFAGPWTNQSTGCGCGNVPKRFKKHEGDLDYDDLYMSYNVPWSFKEGVRIFRD